MSDPANPNPAAPVTPPAAAAPVLPVEVKAQLDKLMADNAALAAREQARTDAEFRASLAKDFPHVKDLSLVAGATHEEMRAHAAKLNAAMAPAPAPAPAPATPPNPGDSLNIPPMGSPGGEAAAAQAKAQTIQELDAAVKRGDVSAVYDKCVALQPEPYKRVIAGAF